MLFFSSRPSGFCQEWPFTLLKLLSDPVSVVLYAAFTVSYHRIL